MAELQDRIALVTGASSGIGEAIVLRLAREGVQLALVGRDEARLEQVAEKARALGAKARIYVADLSVDVDINSLKVAVDDDYGVLDSLVHSAGVVHRGGVEDLPAQAFHYQFKVNTLAPYALTHLFLPLLRRRRGQIVFINSRAGVTVLPELTSYCGTKHALKAVADGLREEVRKDGVRVLSVLAGRIATPLQEALHQEEGRDYDPSSLPSAADVAEVVYSALVLPATTELSDVMIRPQHESEN